MKKSEKEIRQLIEAAKKVKLSGEYGRGFKNGIAFAIAILTETQGEYK